MAQFQKFYNLEDAARVLGMSPDELKAKAQQREVRGFMDNGSWQFRVADVDELARRRGLGSDPDLSLSDLDLPNVPESSDDLDLSEFQLDAAGPGASSRPREAAAPREDDVLLDDLSISSGHQSSASSTIIGMSPAGRYPSDSDVRLIPDAAGKGPSDSDVQLSAPAPRAKGPSDSDVTLISEESDSSVEALVPEGTELASKRPIPSVGSSGEIKTASDDFDASNFELSPSSVIDALEQPDSGSDFELTALDASDEFESVPGPKPGDSDVTGAEPSSSGINLGRPSDSGINLQSVGFLEDADSIELAPLDEDEASAPPPKAKPATPPPAKPRPDLAATPLPTKGQKDIFEDTDFEVDVLDSDSEDRTVQLEAASDFDLDEGESGSEVFAIDEDDVDQNAATALGPAVASADADEEEDLGAADEEDADVGAGWDEDEDAAPASSSRPAAAPVLSAAGAGAEWGGLWVGLLGVATLFTLLLTFVTMDVVRNLYEYRGSNPVSSGLVKSIAGLFGG
jgi:hypothetical protein